MRITSVETFLAPPRWLFCRIETDSGLVGWGEPIVEGRASTVRAAVAELAGYLIGKDPLCIEAHWQVLTKGGFYRGGPVLSSAVAGIDQALWDIAGKFRGAPVHELLGGPVRDRVRMYAWAHGEQLPELLDAIHANVDAGFTAVKINVCDQLAFLDTPRQIGRIVERVAAVRDAVGDGIDVAVDFHGRFSAPMARRVLPVLEPLLPLFVEEPVLPEFTADLGRITASTSIPIATGERLYSRGDFRAAFASGIAVAQPDLSHAGGISEVRRIGAAAETHDVQLAPHCPLGPIALAACLHIGFATPNFLIQEQALGLHDHKVSDGLAYLTDTEPLKLQAGHVERLSKPGLGIEVDEDAVRKADRDGHDWHSPVWRHSDGSFAEW